MRTLALVLSTLAVVACAAEPTVTPSPETVASDSVRRRVPVDPDDPTFGPASAPITIVLFVDFECPHSAAAYRRARALVDASSDVRLAVKHHPLGGHLFAPLAARAAAAAHAQGRFDAMADRLFEAGRMIDRAAVLSAAAAIGLDPARFEADLDHLAIDRQVESDAAQARALGLTGTPAWFVNGVFFKGALDDERLARILELERGLVAELVADGIAPGEVGAHLAAGAGEGPVLPAPAHVELDAGARYAVPVGADDLRFGPDSAPVTIVLFADLECRHTRRQWQAIQRVRSRRDDVRVVVVHDPLPRHRFALAAHLAVATAQDAGRGEELFAALIEGPPLDAAAIDTATASAIARVREGRQLASRFGVRGTPTMFVNGRPVVGVVSPDALGAMVDEEAARVATAPRGGDPYAEAIAGALTSAAPPASPGRPLLPDLGPPVEVAVTDADPARGPADAPVTLIAFMDFECVHSAEAAAAIRRLEERHPGALRVVFKHLPLAMHDDARNAAAAAMAAQAQGRFWEMHDWMFEHQDTLDRGSLERAAVELGLDLDRFRRDFDDPMLTDRPIAAAEEEGRRLGLEGTPILVFDGILVPGLVGDERLDEIVAGRLAEVGG